MLIILGIAVLLVGVVGIPMFNTWRQNNKYAKFSGRLDKTAGHNPLSDTGQVKHRKAYTAGFTS